MIRKLLGVAAALVALFLVAPAFAGNYVLFLQGRGWASWNGETVSATGWTSVTLAYNGSARINGTETNTTVRNAVSTYCSGSNSCILHCYSAGCLRMLKAVNDLRASGNSLPGLLYVEASGSAAGGSRLAETTTTGLTKWIAKLFGQQEKVDYDITTGAARNTWGYVQNNFGAKIYHFGGYLDICKSLIITKLCGNSVVAPGGTGDGAVGMDSYSGASSITPITNACNATKYSWRTYDSGPYYGNAGTNLTPCTGAPRDHFGEPGLGTAMIGADITGTGLDYKRSWSDATLPSTVCSGTGCDAKFSSTAQNYSKTPSLTAVATSVASYASNTTAVDTSGATCYGHCGAKAKTGCWCDSGCAAAGDCCSDYAAANCATVNQ